MNFIQRIAVKVLKIQLEPIYTLSTTDFNIQTSERASGRTTRLADTYIQLLFKTGRIIVHDHHNDGRSNTYLARHIMDRIQIEHGRERFIIKGNQIEIKDFDKFQDWKKERQFY